MNDEGVKVYLFSIYYLIYCIRVLSLCTVCEQHCKCEVNESFEEVEKDELGLQFFCI